MNLKFRTIFIVLVVLLIISNIVMNGREISALYAGVEKYPVFQQVDFSLYYTAARMLAEKGGGVYNPEALARYAADIGRQSIRPDMVNYPPIHYTLMIPIARMNYNDAWKAWLVLNHIFLIASCIFLTLAFFRKSSLRVKISAFFILLLFSLFFAPTIDTMGLGQVNIELLFLVSLCIYLYSVLQGRKTRFISGIPLGLSIAVKGIPAPAALYFLWKKDWKTLGSVIVSYLVFTFLPVTFFGFDILKSYTAVKSRYFFFSGFVLDTSTYGFWKFLMPASQSGPTVLYVITSLILLALSIWFISGKNGDKEESAPEKIALLIALIPLVTPFSWSHHHVLNIIPLTALFSNLWKGENPDSKAYFTLGLGFTVAFILGTSDASFLPFYLYAESVKSRQVLPSILGLPYIYIKAFFRDYRLLFVSNLGLWVVLGYRVYRRHSPGFTGKNTDFHS